MCPLVVWFSANDALDMINWRLSDLFHFIFSSSLDVLINHAHFPLNLSALVFWVGKDFLCKWLSVLSLWRKIHLSNLWWSQYTCFHNHFDSLWLFRWSHRCFFEGNWLMIGDTWCCRSWPGIRKKWYVDFVFFELIGSSDFVFEVFLGGLNIFGSLLVLFFQGVFDVVPVLVKVPLSCEGRVGLFIEMLHEFFDVKRGINSV